jgi:hypothetical protein
MGGTSSATAPIVALFFIASYVAVLVCAYRIRQFVKHNYKGPTMHKLREVNGQLTLTLAIQVQSSIHLHFMGGELIWQLSLRYKLHLKPFLVLTHFLPIFLLFLG